MKKILLSFLLLIPFFVSGQTGIYKPATASGTNTYSATVPNLIAYEPNQRFTITFTNGNTGVSTLDLDGAGALGALPLKKNGASALISGDIPAGSIKLLIYDGTNLQIIGDGSSSGGGGSVTSVVGQTGDVSTVQIKNALTKKYWDIIIDGAAVGDGSTDNLAAIQAVINGASNDDVIHIPGGRFLVSGKLTCTKRLRFVGEGLETSVLAITANNTILEFSTSGADRSSVNNIGFDGTDSGSSQNGIVFTGVSQCYAFACSFTDFLGAGLTMSGNSIAPYENGYVSHCRSSSNPGIGFRLTGQYITVNNSFGSSDGVSIKNEAGNNRIIGGTYDNSTVGIESTTSGDTGKFQILGVSANHCGTTVSLANSISPITVDMNAVVGSFTITNCADVDITGYVPGLSITSQPASSKVNVHDAFISGGVTATSLNATAKITYSFCTFTTSGPGFIRDASGIVTQFENYDLIHNPVIIPNSTNSMFLNSATNQLQIGSTRFVTLNLPTPATASRTYTAEDPGADDTFAWKNFTQTLTNKTLTSPKINFGSDADGDLYIRSGGILSRLPIGADAKVLTVSSGLPAWLDASGGGGGMTNPMTTDGDIIVGGASGTPTRLAAGSTSGHVLTSNGSGVAPSWQASGAGGEVLEYRRSGNFYGPSVNGVAAITQAVANGSLRAYAWRVLESITIDRILIEVSTAVASTNVRIGLYTDNGSVYPNALITNSDTGVFDSSTTGVKTNTPAANITLTQGLYWIVVNSDGAPTLRYYASAGIYPAIGHTNASGFAALTEYRVASAFGALPSTYPGGATSFTNNVVGALFRAN